MPGLGRGAAFSGAQSVDDKQARTGFSGRPMGGDVIRDLVGHACCEGVRGTALDLGEEHALKYEKDMTP